MLGALLASYAGWAALALAMPRHHRTIRHRPPGPALALGLRAAGALALIAAFVTCVAAEGWAIGPVAWLGVLTASALAVVLLLASAPRLAVCGVVPALAGAAVATFAI